MLEDAARKPRHMVGGLGVQYSLWIPVAGVVKGSEDLVLEEVEGVVGGNRRSSRRDELQRRIDLGIDLLSWVNVDR
jgi:hypothetical protein